MLPGNMSGPDRCTSTDNVSSVLAASTIGQETEELGVPWAEFVVGEANECHIYGCIQRKNGFKATATGHNCSVCLNAVHINCCSILLGMSIEDDTVALFCSSCAPSGLGNVIPSPLFPTAPKVLKVPANKTESFDNRINKMKGSDVESSDGGSKRSGAFCRSYQQARKDWDNFLCNGALPDSFKTKTRRNEDEIKAALNFIFQFPNIQMLSWGTKRIKVGNERLLFPALLRRKTSEKMYRDYVSSIQAISEDIIQTNTTKPLGRTVFLQIVDNVTRGQLKRKAAVDYVLCTLVYDNIRTLRELVRAEMIHDEDQNLFLSQLDAVEEFMKFTMLEHISADSDTLHDPDFALHASIDNGDKVETQCMTCLSPFQVVDNIRRKTGSEREDIVEFLQDAEEKMVLYMGHQHRCYNQERRISDIFGELREDVALSKADVLPDYKMKFEPIRYREKTTEFFGKKGIEWHGAAIFYCRADSSHETENVSSQHVPVPQTGTIETLFLITSRAMT